MSDWVIGAGTTVYATAAALGILFPVTYSVMTRWWRSAARREALYIILLSVSLAAVFGYLVAANAGWLGTLDESGHRAVVRLVVGVIGLLVLVGLLVLLLWAQTEQRRKARVHRNSRKD